MSSDHQPESNRRGQRPDPFNSQNPFGRTDKNAGSDRDKEIDPLHELVLQARKAPPDVQRITTQQIKALRVTTEKEAGASVSFFRAIQGFFSGIFGALAGLFHRDTYKPSQQCEIYGHVVPQGWHGAYPKCEKCGAEVTSPDQLRGSSQKGKRS